MEATSPPPVFLFNLIPGLSAPPCTIRLPSGVALPIPTLPTSSTVTTFVAPSNKLTKSAVPL